MNNNDELMQLWQSYDKKLNTSLAINKHCIEAIQTQKILTAFSHVKAYNYVEIGTGLFCMWLLGSFLANNITNLYFVAAAAVLMLFCLVAIIGAAHQLVLIGQLQYSGAVIAGQRKLTLMQSTVFIQTSIVTYLRLALLSLPFYTAYLIIGFKVFFGINIVEQGNSNWWISQIVLSILFVPLSIWMYKKISYKNLHIPWVRTLIEGAGGKATRKAMDYIQELNEFEKELA